MTARSMSPKDPQAIPLPIALGWGLGSLGMSTVFQAFSLLLLRFLTDYMGIAAAVAGLMISVSKIFDAVVDPAIGILSDRTRSRWGRRRPFIFVGGFTCAITFFLMFNISHSSSLAVRTLLVEASLLGFAAGYALFNIPYLAMPPEMSSSSHARTTLIGYRVIAVGVGSLFASFVGPLLITLGGGGAGGHRVMAAAVALLTLAASLGCFLLTSRARSTRHATGPDPSFRNQLSTALQNKPFTSLILVKLLSLIGAGVTFSIVPFLFVAIMRYNYALMGIYFLFYYISLIGTQPVWVILCRKFGKKAIYLAAAPAIMLATVSWVLARPGEPLPLIFLRGVVLGCLGGSTLLVIQGMLPDTIQNDFLLTGLRREGLYAGVYTTIEKLAFALSAGIVGAVLGAAGYIASTGAKVVQPSSVRGAILFLAVFPAFCMFLSCVFLLRYHLPESALISDDRPSLMEI